MIKDSIGSEYDLQKQQGDKLCEIMLFGVFEQHLKKIAQVMQLNIDLIKRNKAILQKYYVGANVANSSRIFRYYCMVLLKQMQCLGQREVIYMLQDRSYKIKLSSIKKYREYQKQMVEYIAKMQDIPSKQQKINIQK